MTNPVATKSGRNTNQANEAPKSYADIYESRNRQPFKQGKGEPNKKQNWPNK